LNIKKGEIIELKIEDYAFEGKGLAKISVEGEEKKFVVFVNGSYPGDKVKAQIIKKKRSYAEARVTEIIEPSEFRITAKCSYFRTCGGCKQQDLDYDVQLKYKSEQVKDIFERIGGFTDFIFEPIIPSEKIFFYRNKMEFSFADKRWLTKDEINRSDDIKDRNFAVGLHIPRIYDKVLDIEECFLQSEESNKILNFTRDYFKKKNSSIYSTKTHEGYLRHLVIKQSSHTDDLMVNLVTSEENEELFKDYTEQLIKTVPEITTVINNINFKKAQVAIGDIEKVYYGDGYIYDYIGNNKFRISANSFFQTNTNQAVHLYNTALEYADLSGDEVIYDLYAGAGTISIFVAGNAKEVYAFESVESAIEDAKVNNKLNKIENVHYLKANLDKSFIQIIGQNISKPDIIIVDPPRSGMNPKTVKDVIQLLPSKIVYVSCNPTTQARDIKLLNEAGFKLVKIRPVDMFPHTHHIENVALLVKK